MEKALLCADKETETEAVFERNGDNIYRLCRSFMKTREDAEDAVQETFLKLMRSNMRFASAEHEKAWLIVTASNTCRDMLKKRSRRDENIDDHFELAAEQSGDLSEIREAIRALPDKYKTAVFMFYYMGYSTDEIARILSQPPSTVRNHLGRARKMLKNMLGGDNNA